MNKGELSQALAKKMGISENQANDALNAILEEITKALSKGEEVNITGFGKFSAVRSKARTGVNPQTGEKIKIAARTLPRFKAGKSLKQAVK